MSYFNLLMASVMFATGNNLAGVISLAGAVVCMCCETDDELED